MAEWKLKIAATWAHIETSKIILIMIRTDILYQYSLAFED